MRRLPDLLSGYLRGEQRLGRIAEAADIVAVVILTVGAIHRQVLPRLIFRPPGTAIVTDADVPGRLAETILAGIAPFVIKAWTSGVAPGHPVTRVSLGQPMVVAA